MVGGRRAQIEEVLRRTRQLLQVRDPARFSSRFFYRPGARAPQYETPALLVFRVLWSGGTADDAMEVLRTSIAELFDRPLNKSRALSLHGDLAELAEWLSLHKIRD